MSKGLLKGALLVESFVMGPGSFGIRNIWNKNLPTFKAQLRRFAAAPTNVYIRDKENYNIGTLGHVHHGKTTLTAAITKVFSEKGLSDLKMPEDIDTSTEEIARGHSINVSSIEYSSEKRHYTHLDIPGHENFIKNMIVGASRLDGAILVIAATDGVMDQTKEHVMLAKHIGVKNFVLYINKADAADEGMAEVTQIEAQEYLTEQGFDGDNVPCIVGSALCALNGERDDIGKNSILKLVDALDTHLPMPERHPDKPFYLSIGKTYAVPDKGTVAMGLLKQGKVKKNTEVELLGFGHKHKAFVTGGEIFRKTVEEGQAGDNLSLSIKGVKFAEILKGMVISKPKLLNQHDQIEAEVYRPLQKEGGFSNALQDGHRCTLYTNCCNVAATAFRIEEEVKLGQNGRMKIMCHLPILIEEGQKFVLREGSTTIAVGTTTKVLGNLSRQQIEDIVSPKKKKKNPQSKV